MKVRELIEELKKQDQELEVVIEVLRWGDREEGSVEVLEVRDSLYWDRKVLYLEEE